MEQRSVSRCSTRSRQCSPARSSTTSGWHRIGAGQGAAGRLPGAAAARAHCAAATAQQPRGAGSAVEGACTTPRRPSLVLRLTETPPAKPATIAPSPGWGFQVSGDLLRWLAGMVVWQPPSGGSRPVPIGSQSIGVRLQPAIPRRPAEPASASPVTGNSNSIPIQRGNQNPLLDFSLQGCSSGRSRRLRRQRGVISTLHAG